MFWYAALLQSNPDPLEKPVFGGSTRDLARVAAYVGAVEKLQQTVGGNFQPGANGGGGHGGRRRAGRREAHGRDLVRLRGEGFGVGREGAAAQEGPRRRPDGVPLVGV